MIRSFSSQEILFCFALESEAADVFDGHNVLFTGIGKVQAAYALTKALATQRPKLIINLGTVGSTHFPKGTVVHCTQFVQRDMDVRGLGFKLYETPLSGLPVVLEYGQSFAGLPHAVCGTGDSFEMEHAESLYTVVDMEAYALAYIAQQEKIPFLCLKYISDGADDKAATDWTEQVHKAAEAYGKLLLG
ncbi:MAG: nucleosidase [Flavobacterium sp.]|jgi:adenosylhomocysteine nucleosidase|uniref:5'-methylthioadenosine/S-adenosylhomocysteine nucleosidase family protein n=1 Tax=Flavobacterium sp. TaxID=239 RepID=UPI0022BE79D1|nr:nucleosidase [Flavobacterium sp.]MCZ8169252.1 nucleosidase [Flavobacterium sp.]MCZ8297613.1 nucleosidase [Flavobacterium sp.]